MRLSRKVLADAQSDACARRSGSCCRLFRGADRDALAHCCSSCAGITNPTASHYRRRHPAFNAQVNAILGRPLDHDNSRQTFSNARQRIFLDHLAQSGCASDAAKAAGVSNGAPYDRRRRDMAFAAAWAAARDEATDRAFGRVLKQAIHGFERTETLNGVEKHIVSHEAGTVLKLLDRYDAKRSRQPGTGRFIELTPERVAAARTSILRRLNDGGSLITMGKVRCTLNPPRSCVAGCSAIRNKSSMSISEFS